MSRTGGPKRPYTTAVMTDGEFHFIRLVLGGGHYGASGGREGTVQYLADREAKEIINPGPPRCPRCFTVAWQYRLLREVRRGES